MIDLVASAVVAVYTALGLLHVYWGLGGRTAWVAAVPEVGGRAAFTPSAAACFVVAAGLFGFAGVVAGVAGFTRLPLPGAWQVRLAWALAAVMLVRAVGDFRLVGFFKTVTGSRFAELDTAVYSPLCLALAVGVAVVAWHPRG